VPFRFGLEGFTFYLSFAVAEAPSPKQVESKGGVRRVVTMPPDSIPVGEKGAVGEIEKLDSRGALGATGQIKNEKKKETGPQGAIGKKICHQEKRGLNR